MKKVFSLVIALLVGSSTVLVAQQQKQTRQQQGKQKIEQAKIELDLDQKQSVEWDNIHDKFMKDLQALKADDSLSDEERKAKAKVFRDEKDGSLKSILTADQYERYIEYGKEARKQYKQQNNRGLSSGQKGNKSANQQKLMDDLNLSDDQQVKWDAIHKSYKDKMNEIKYDDSISSEKRKEISRSTRGEMKAELMAILTPEQQVTMQKHEEERKKNREQNGGGNGQPAKTD